MFEYKNGIYVSDFLKVSHGFSTRNGGVSTLEHTKSMNVGFKRGPSLPLGKKIGCQKKGFKSK